MAVAAFARDPVGRTCWGAFDFDCGADDGVEARRLAEAALGEVLKNNNKYSVFEDTGHGCHLTIFKTEFQSCEAWSKYLTDIARRIGVA